MQESRALTTISTKHKKEVTNFLNLLTQKNSSLEELMKHLMELIKNLVDLKRITQDSWLKLKLYKETSMANSTINQNCKDKLKAKILEIENCKLNNMRENKDSDKSKTKLWLLEKNKTISDSATTTCSKETKMLNLKLVLSEITVTYYKARIKILMLNSNVSL
jgi:predicted small metal-binding protein